MANSYFNAFISYRHSPVDAAVAAEIQKKLERYHIPKQIQKKYGIKKFERIFRDTSELELTSDLGAQLDDAIRASEFLIVICSPRYMESGWCLREIEVFLQNHSRDHVLCVLAEGEPPGIFPPILMQGSEPLACDYRGKFREAEKVELPRLACAMIGCSYDELIMRTTQYKRRRRTALVSVILSLAAIAVAYLLYSNARIRAQYQQTLINESKTLSAQSLDAMSARDRYHALEYALSALPSEDLDRPVTSEALYALHKASGAYLLPYQVAQTRLFDGAQDFEQMVLLEKSGYVAAMDSSGTIFVYDPSSGTLVSSFAAFAGHGSESVPSLVTTPEDLLVTAWNGMVRAYQPDGTLSWEQTLGYMEESGLSNYPNPIHLSPDQKTICCGDLSAIQVMSTEDGTPVASYRLPKDYPHSIQDFAWAPDGSAIAVQLSLDNGNDAFGILEAEHGSFTKIDGEFSLLSDFHWDALSQLLIFCRTYDESSFSSGPSYEYLYFQELAVFAYDTSGSEIFDLTIPFTAESFAIESGIFYINSHPILALSASSCLSLLDPSTGDVLLSYDLGESIVRLIDVTPVSTRLVTSSGKIATVWYSQASSTLVTQFPEGLSDILVQQGQIDEADRYFLLKDGDIYLFESAQDDSVLLADEPDSGMSDLPENLYVCEDSAVLKEGGDIRLYHLPDLKVIAKKSYGDHKAIRLLGVIPEREAAAVLVIDIDTGTIMLELLDVTNGELQASYKLKATDYYYASGILDMYASTVDASQEFYAKRMFLEISYQKTEGGIQLSSGVLAYHDYQSPNTVYLLDLVSSEETSFTPALGDGQKLLSGSFESSLSPLWLSPDHAFLFTIVQEEDHEPRGVLLNADESKDGGKALILPETESSSSLLAAWSPDSARIAVTGTSSLLIYGTDGTLSASIPYPGNQPFALTFLSDGTLAVCYPKGILMHYAADGSVLHEVQLSYSELSYVSASTFQLFETKDFLVVLCQEQLEMIDLSVFGSRPDVTVPTHALGYSEKTDQLLVYAFQYMDASMRYHLGAFDRYSLDDLIKKGSDALSGIAP
ncbi:MAG: TIR domain-containing protein [Firmicutes bacterium]|nr:TIR domain-containing protein [Bacillota bacterium]